MKPRPVLLLSTLLLYACASRDLHLTTHDGVIDEPLVVTNNDEIYFRKIKLQVNSIEDTRCPLDVQCIHGGNALVMLQVVSTNQSIALSIPPDTSRGLNDSFQFSSGSRRYRLNLIEVSPYPSTKNAEETRSAKVVLTLAE